jgi:hypothetical protein
MDTEARIRRLERSMWCWRGLALALGVAALVGMTRVPSKVLECERLVVKHESGAEIVLGYSEMLIPSGYLIFRDEDGDDVLSLAHIGDHMSSLRSGDELYLSSHGVARIGDIQISSDRVGLLGKSGRIRASARMYQADGTVYQPAP